MNVPLEKLADHQNEQTTTDEMEFQRLCNSMPEIMLYYTINELGRFIWRMNHDMADGRIPIADHPAIDESLLEAQQKIQIAVDTTARFGVEQPRNAEGVANPGYWKWFRWWDAYAKGLSDEQFQKLNVALETYRHVTDMLKQWRPEGDWKTP